MSSTMIKAPNKVPQADLFPTIFMAGSIEMGKATDWQTELFEATKHLGIRYLNPRRDDWDSSWVQEITNSQFREQVEWELDGLMKLSDYQIFVFDPNTTSPITLMELGMCAWDDSVIGVVCPSGYFRKGNVDILCHRFDIPVVETLPELIYLIAERLY